MLESVTVWCRWLRKNQVSETVGGVLASGSVSHTWRRTCGPAVLLKNRRVSSSSSSSFPSSSPTVHCSVSPMVRSLCVERRRAYNPIYVQCESYFLPPRSPIIIFWFVFIMTVTTVSSYSLSEDRIFHRINWSSVYPNSIQWNEILISARLNLIMIKLCNRYNLLRYNDTVIGPYRS